MDTSLNLQSAFRAANFDPKSLEEPGAWVGHIPFANWLILETRPDVFVELGTHTGNSYFSFCQTINDYALRTKAFSVDTWQGDSHAGFYSESVFEYVKETNKGYQSFSTLLRKTFDDASEMFSDNSIDLLHIDGLHTYQAVSHDFTTWLPKMSDKGIVILHDTNVFRDDFGVHKLFRELEQKYDSMNFLHSHGLGVLRVGKNSPDIIPKTTDGQLVFQQFFEALGNRLVSRLAFETQINALNSKNIQLQSSVQQATDTIDEINQSLSWKVTAPIRRLGKIFS